jgi:glycosyltransferase involved in cell wall biosynthesis
MRVLFLTAHLPFPPFSGGRRREFELISRLSKKFEIHLCSVTKTWEIDNTYVNNMLSYCSTVNLFKAVPAVMQQGIPYSFQMKRHLSHEARSHISHELGRHYYDIVHVEGYYLMQLLPSKLKIPIILVEHNIEYLLTLQRFMLSTSSQEKSRYWQEYVYTLKWERIFWRRAKICVTLTVEDKIAMKRLESDINIKMIPDGIDHLKDNGAHKRQGNILNSHIARAMGSRILLVGNFAYEPNIDAALYFSNQIFPLVLQAVPNAKLFIVGNEPPPQILSLRSNRQIVVTGYVESVIPFYRMADVVVCPLRIGGGIKVKVLEALYAGKAIVSTSVGAQGLGSNTRQALTVANDVTHFAQSVIRLLQDPEERLKLERNALTYAKNLPTWDHATQAFVKCYEETISCRRKKQLVR